MGTRVAFKLFNRVSGDGLADTLTCVIVNRVTGFIWLARLPAGEGYPVNLWPSGRLHHLMHLWCRVALPGASLHSSYHSGHLTQSG